MRVETTRRIGYFTATYFSIFLLIILLVVPVNTTFSSQTLEEEQFPQSIIAASSTDTTPHSLELKAVQDEDNAEPRKVSRFRLDMTNVATAQINSQLLVFVTDSSVRVLEAKVRTVSDQLIDLVPSTQANAFSLANLPVGVYTLDVITQKGNAKAAYEGILVISQQPTTVISETTKNIINQGINQNTRVVIDDDDDDDEDDNCPAGYIGKPPFCERRVCMKNSDAEGCPPLPRPPDCPQGFVGKPPFCEPVDCNENPEAEGCEGLPSPPQDPCDTDNPPDFCEEPPVCIDPSCAPTECPDGRIVPPGQSCDEKENDEEEDEGEETPPKEILGEGDAAGDEEDAGGEEEQGGDGENGDEQVREEGRE